MRYIVHRGNHSDVPETVQEIVKPAQGPDPVAIRGDILAIGVGRLLGLQQWVPPAALVPVDSIAIRLSTPRESSARIVEETLTQAVGGDPGVVPAVIVHQPAGAGREPAPAECGRELTEDCEDHDEWGALSAFDFVQGLTDRHAASRIMSAPSGAATLRQWSDHDAADVALLYNKLPVYASGGDAYWRLQAQVHNVRASALLRGECVVSAAVAARIRVWSSAAWTRYLAAFPAPEASAAHRIPERRSQTIAVGFDAGRAIPACAPAGRLVQLSAALSALAAPDRDAVVADLRRLAAADVIACGGSEEQARDFVEEPAETPACGHLSCNHLVPHDCRQFDVACIEACAEALLPLENRQRIDLRVAYLDDHYRACASLVAE